MPSDFCVVLNNQFRDQLTAFAKRVASTPGARVVFQPYTGNRLKQVHDIAKPLPVYCIEGQYGNKVVASGILHAAEYLEDLSSRDVADVRRLISQFDEGVYARSLLFVSDVSMLSSSVAVSAFRKRIDGTPLLPWRSPAVVCHLPRQRRLTVLLNADADDELGGVEGKLRLRLVRHRHREARLRKAKIAQALRRDGSLVCEVSTCGFNFAEAYGALGANYAQVHHLDPLGMRKESQKTPLKHLAIVCCNCHAMIHRYGESRSLSDVAATMTAAHRSLASA